MAALTVQHRRLAIAIRFPTVRDRLAEYALMMNPIRMVRSSANGRATDRRYNRNRADDRLREHSACKPNDAVLLDLLGEWGSDDAVRRRILVDNPETLYGFAKSG